MAFQGTVSRGRLRLLAALFGGPGVPQAQAQSLLWRLGLTIEEDSWPQATQWWMLGRVARAHSSAEVELATEAANAPETAPTEASVPRPKRQAPDLRFVPPTKVCTVCDLERPAADFAWRLTSPDFLDFRCRGCYAVQSYAARGKTFVGVHVPAKQCKMCKEVRPGTFFAACASSPDQLQPRCRTCAAKVSEERFNRLAEVRKWFDPQPTTVCRQCDQELPTEVFHQDNYSNTGRASVCPRCCYERVTRRRAGLKPVKGPQVSAKRCSTCRQTKEARDFFKHSYSVDGLMYVCKECLKEKRPSKGARRAALKSKVDAVPVQQPIL